MMALGLNFVVGYAGLLDLGYVAFYAMGAYMAGWFASDQFSNRTRRLRRRRPLPGWAGHPPLDLARAADRRASSPRSIGVIIGLPTLRLRGDYLAIVTLGFGEIMPQVAEQRRQPLRLQPHERLGRDHADRRRPASATGRRATSHLPANYLHAAELRLRLLLDGARARAAHDLHLGTAARLAARPRLGRDPRGRDRRRRDGHAADADEDVGVRDGRLLRRGRRRLLRELQQRRLPLGLLLQHLGLHPLHGHPRRDGQHLSASSSAPASSPT